jgi:hypothetical protein
MDKIVIHMEWFMFFFSIVLRLSIFLQFSLFHQKLLPLLSHYHHRTTTSSFVFFKGSFFHCCIVKKFPISFFRDFSFKSITSMKKRKNVETKWQRQQLWISSISTNLYKTDIPMNKIERRDKKVFFFFLTNKKGIFIW